MRNSGRFPQGKSAATESCYPTRINYKVHAGSFCVSIIHRILTWTTWFLTRTCVRDHSCACIIVHTGGCRAHQLASQYNIFDSAKNVQLCLVLQTGFFFFSRSQFTPSVRSARWIGLSSPDLPCTHTALSAVRSPLAKWSSGCHGVGTSVREKAKGEVTLTETSRAEVGDSRPHGAL